MIRCGGKDRDHIKVQGFSWFDFEPVLPFRQDPIPRAAHDKAKGLARCVGPARPKRIVERHELQHILATDDAKRLPEMRSKVIGGQGLTHRSSSPSSIGNRAYPQPYDDSRR